MNKRAASAALGWEEILGHLPANWRELSEEHGIRFGNRNGAKLKGIEELLRLVFFVVSHNASLVSTVARAAACGLPAITAVSLHQRFRTLGPYLETLLNLMIEANSASKPERWNGFDVLAVDGSSVMRPGADGTTVRVHYVMRVTDYQGVQIRVTDNKTGETYKNFSFKPGQLWVADRGYAHPPGIAYLSAAGADALVRFNWAAMPLFDRAGAPFDVFKHLPGSTIHKPLQWRVSVGKRRTPGRLIIQRLPPKEAKRSRKSLLKENPKASAKAIRAAGFRMLFTTVPATRLKAHDALELYCLRWQIELRFKRDKSIAGLDNLPNSRDDTIHAWICAKLLLNEIAQSIARKAMDLPPWAPNVSEKAACLVPAQYLERHPLGVDVHRGRDSPNHH